ncbi:MAG TPA: HAD family phosphatase [Kosmotoga arenicorallina]|uniref:HAD family phosphatase n=1 Tax=Kosmotoga arenicorallina TaxID=688066 RepID=A0A7C5DXC3_9BACT|nr:MAG: hypothetical protein DRP20_04095 [Thermotogota bacterium]HHF08799.1 HAD family phosphatase [Kosmotoga arenicorallina]
MNCLGGGSRVIKLLVTDLDGTLLDKDHLVNRCVASTLEKIRSMGLDITFATGRALHATKPYTEALNIEKPVILLNGARIYDPVADKYLVQYRFQKSSVVRILNSEFTKRATVGIFIEDETYLWNVHTGASDYIYRDAMTYRSTKDPFSLDLNSVVKIVFSSFPEVLNDIYESCKFELRNAAEIVRSERDLIEFLPPGVNKGTALEKLCSLLEIKMENVIAVGDSLNDLQMIKKAGVGVAVGNASEEVKRVSKIVLGANRGEGFKELIEHLQRLGEI